ncbi:hypothetical protein Q9R46_10840 [Paenibacillus sp. RRE4]|uniref:hypothetical protein n=1 Tax=Paenibacillus sp. RRE4 TaxID=2962587 RepID=UPI00288279EA|nr:hypothetical protein [Paenibacillus sp. RRE4]MDT0123138.1 hypothetical protein [Paenibacillus sp. RRE4]
MEEDSGLIQQLSDCSEELLLRGLSQFSIRDTQLLEQLGTNAQRLQMHFLYELISGVLEAGRKVALGEGQEEQLLDQYCRLTQYVQLSKQSQT